MGAEEAVVMEEEEKSGNIDGEIDTVADALRNLEGWPCE